MARGREQFLKIYKEEDGKEKGEEEEEERQREIRFRRGQEEEGDLSRLDESGTQLVDPCSSTQFKMNMVMPRMSTVLEEEDVDLDII